MPAEVAAACEMLGLDPLYVANEGVLVVTVPGAVATDAQEALWRHLLGRWAVLVGRVTGGGGPPRAGGAPYGPGRHQDRRCASGGPVAPNLWTGGQLQRIFILGHPTLYPPREQPNMRSTVLATAALALVAVPAVAQQPAPRLRVAPRLPFQGPDVRVRIPEFRMRMNRTPELRFRLQRLPELRYRLDVGRMQMLDRHRLRGFEMQQRVMERLRDRLEQGRMHQPMFRPRRFRVI